jgi:hypothetical protein
MKSKVAVLFFVSAFVFCGICLIQSRQNQTLKHQIATLRQTLEERDREKPADDALKRELTEQQEALNREVARLAGEVQSLRAGALRPSSTVQTTPGASATAKKEDGFGGFLTKMLEDPEMKKLMRQQQMAGLDSMYRSLFKQMGLSAEEIKQFKDLLVDNQMRGVENAGVFFSGETDAARRMEAGKAITEAQKQSEEEIKNFLGEERYAQYKDYQEMFSERMTLDQFKEHLGGGQNSLSDDQTRQLLVIMKEEDKSVAPGFGVNDANGATDFILSVNDANGVNDFSQFEATMSEEQLNNQLQQQEEVNQRILDRARAVLTPEQLNSLGSFQTNQLQMQRFGMSMAMKMMGGKKSEETAPVSGKP